MIPGECIIVLIPATNRSQKFFCQPCGSTYGITNYNTSSVEDNREFGIRQQSCRFLDGVFSTSWFFKPDRLGQFYIDYLGPEVSRNIDLGRCTSSPGLFNNPVQNFCHPAGVPDFFLITYHIFEKFHLLNFLKATLTHGLIGSLRSYEQDWRVIPVSGFHGGYKICNTGSILGNHH